MDELAATKTDLTRERTELLSEVSKLRSQLDRAMACQEDTEKKRLETEARLQNITEEMQVSCCRTQIVFHAGFNSGFRPAAFFQISRSSDAGRTLADFSFSCM